MEQQPRHSIFRKMAACHKPVRVQMELTRQCNLDCVHCMVGAGMEEEPGLSGDEFRRLLRQLSAAGTFHLNLTGGEPFIRPDAAELIQAVFDEGFLLTLQTNGTLMQERHVELLKSHARQVRQIGISLYSAGPAAHDAVTRTPGSHEGAVSAILALRDAGLPVVAVMALTSVNADEYDGVERFCREHGLMFQFNTLITPRDDGGVSPLALRLDADRLCRLPKPWETFMDDLPLELGDLGPDRPLSAWCSMGATSCYITAAGDVRPCSTVNIPAGNVKSQSFEEIWLHGEIFEKIRAFRLKDFQCFECEHFPVCHPCPGLAFMEHGSFTAPAKEICRINSVFIGGKGDMR
jgi:radical SAM protein with 4Fe4S-binding SPASM domain